MQIDNITEKTYEKMKENIDAGAPIHQNEYGYIIDNEFYLMFDIGKKEQKQLLDVLIN